MAAEPLSFARNRPSPAQKEEDSRQTPETSE
jgi:hypothetical protein